MARKRKNDDICVIGLGRFGGAVVSQLAKMNCPLLLIDKDEEVLKSYADLAQKVVIAEAADMKALKALNIQEIGTVVVSVPDNIEIVAALLELKVNNIIARATSKRHARVLKQIGVNVIVRPEHEAGVRTALLAANPNFSHYSQTLQEIGDGFVMGTTILNNEELINKPIKELKFFDLGISVVLIKRGTGSILPTGVTVLQKGDLITILGKVEDVTNAFGLLNVED
ncbi:TrkA family potassium uptake protein [Mycoplasmopsis caviae]|uniref:Potassium uptake protein A n=1 Tax=Mycoplasmopsis caviae TaxID=55603 RepID=A0A3P8KAL5_9BACT|nr:TrkA family potassium uptake protein [Mycoplasmopsis caviae]UUD34722.1 TrkA family potassium uptake protein [Mycoplasmopsis caviae]VDR42419.1 potassium uptake protein A [Mycoplasmopsis caviae]